MHTAHLPTRMACNTKQQFTQWLEGFHLFFFTPQQKPKVFGPSQKKKRKHGGKRGFVNVFFFLKDISTMWKSNLTNRIGGSKLNTVKASVHDTAALAEIFTGTFKQKLGFGYPPGNYCNISHRQGIENPRLKSVKPEGIGPQKPMEKLMGFETLKSGSYNPWKMKVKVGSRHMVVEILVYDVCTSHVVNQIIKDPTSITAFAKLRSQDCFLCKIKDLKQKVNLLVI